MGDARIGTEEDEEKKRRKTGQNENPSGMQ